MKYNLPLLLALLAGCASTSAPAGVPGGARLVAETPAPLSFIAPEPGTVYLHDRAGDKVLFEARVDPGQRVGVDTATGRLTVDGRPAKDAPTITAEHAYTLFFKPAGQREYHPAYNP